MVLGKHSGRHAFVDRVKALGFHPEQDVVDQVFSQFKELADRKKVVTDKDIEALMENRVAAVEEIYTLANFVINSGNSMTATASVALKHKDGQLFEDVSTGDGPVDAAFKAIERIAGVEYTLEDYTIHAVTGGKDAQGEVSVRIRSVEHTYKGRGLSTDIIEASIKACLNAVNRMLQEEGHADKE
jgi:2-isopropylmalate synthase